MNLLLGVRHVLYSKLSVLIANPKSKLSFLAYPDFKLQAYMRMKQPILPLAYALLYWTLVSSILFLDT